MKQKPINGFISNYLDRKLRGVQAVVGYYPRPNLQFTTVDYLFNYLRPQSMHHLAHDFHGGGLEQRILAEESCPDPALPWNGLPPIRFEELGSYLKLLPMAGVH